VTLPKQTHKAQCRWPCPNLLPVNYCLFSTLQLPIWSWSQLPAYWLLQIELL